MLLFSSFSLSPLAEPSRTVLDGEPCKNTDIYYSVLCLEIPASQWEEALRGGSHTNAHATVYEKYLWRTREMSSFCWGQQRCHAIAV